jgi:eukaryotic-like serine/threonine-protein kinase
MPKRLGRYEVRGKIGEGGMATVYLGHLREAAQPPGRLVALKVIKEVYSLNTEFVTMFSDEAKIVSRLSHPNIVQVYELGAEGNRLFIAMEFLNGQSLWHVWNACRERGVRLRYDVAAWIGARAAEGLHHAHELHDPHGNLLNIVHRDVNASNIFITYDGRVKIIDFGLAKAANRLSKTRAGMVKGKLAYMAPEQAVGQALDRRTDIFALGTTLWEVTADRRLFKGEDDVETLERVHAADVPDPTMLVEGFPEDLWQVLRRALQRDPKARYRDAAEMSVALDRVAMSEGRAVNQDVVGGIMQALFTEEKAAHDKWIAEASVTVAMGLEMPVMRPGVSVSESLAQMPDVPMPQQSTTLIMSTADFAPASSRMMPMAAPSQPAHHGSQPPVLSARDFVERPSTPALHGPGHAHAQGPGSRTPAMPGRALDPRQSSFPPGASGETAIPLVQRKRSPVLWLVLLALGVAVAAAVFLVLVLRHR